MSLVVTGHHYEVAYNYYWEGWRVTWSNRASPPSGIQSLERRESHLVYQNITAKWHTGT